MTIPAPTTITVDFASNFQGSVPSQGVKVSIGPNGDCDVFNAVLYNGTEVNVTDGSRVGQQFVINFSVLNLPNAAPNTFPEIYFSARKGIATNGYVLSNFQTYLRERVYNNGGPIPSGTPIDPFEGTIVLMWSGTVWMVVTGVGIIAHQQI